ncbi:uncharacterized protein F4822DRAFT_440313 [Hypoxylon trugodes]|uniref:uncharacterized protein n=1 Tax=Hypoxylon trugodes TaxID=326681 RepID=UPI002191A0DE|nr:uncharacterized protein F4822DRAFT_440313 [Hypoxylon trugodes]KAI1384171.1 hypothetical protein F4822DRAFT_440313 [Hypoxylon trugodes]
MKVIISMFTGVAAFASMRAINTLTPFNTPVSPIEGYTVVPLSMEGAIEPGGEVMKFNGNFRSIFAQIRRIKPDFEWDDFQSAAPPTSLTGRSSTEKSITHSLCTPNCKPGFRSLALMGYDYLQQLHKNCGVDAGPRKCSVVYCFQYTKIWFCNDNDKSISFPCENLNPYILQLIGMTNCTQFPREKGMETLKAQIFDSGGWNIIVGGDGDHCCEQDDPDC